MMNRTFAPWAALERRDACTVRSDDGSLVVSMQWTPEGMFVERTMQRPGMSRVVQDVVFGTADEFRRWCNADQARFDYPLLYANLARNADAIFSGNTDAIPAG